MDKPMLEITTIQEKSNVSLSQEVYYFMLMQVPFGKITRFNDIEEYLAKKYGVHHIHEFKTTDLIFRNLSNPDSRYIERIIAHVPMHREVSAIGYIEHGSEQVRKLECEGHEIIQKGAKKTNAVKDYKKHLFDFDRETSISLDTLKKIDKEGLFDYLL